MAPRAIALLGCFMTRRTIMIDKAKLALIGAVAAVLFASPALAQAGVHDARRNGLHAYAMEPQHARRTTLDAARAAAIHDCNIEADKYSPITQLPNQLAVYGTCMAEHGQRFD
jgi:hypothetical protein